MLHALNNRYAQSSYIKIREDLAIYDKQVDAMRNVVKQLGTIRIKCHTLLAGYFIKSGMSDLRFFDLIFLN